MATQIASLYADIGAKTDGFEKGAASVKSGLKDVGNSAELAQQKLNVLGTVVSVTTALIAASYAEYANLSESVRDLSLVSGENAEETSRFIQVLDDFQITAEDATAAAKKLKDDGLSPSIETLAMLSDQFRGIKDPAERMDFVYEKLGKSGAKFVNILNQGSDAIRKNADAISDSLILSDMEIKMYEVGRLAIDEKMDALAAFRVELGKNVGNVLAFASAMERATEIQNESTVVVGGQKRSTIEYSEALNMAIAEQLKAAEASAEYTHNLEEEKKAAEEAEKANRELQKAYADIIDGAIDITNAQKDYQEEQQNILDKIAETRAEGEKLYPWEHEKILENQQALEELGQQYFENQEKFKKASEERLAMMAIEAIALSDGVAGFSEAEYERARVILETQDIATAAAFEEQQAMTMLADAVAQGIVPVEEWGAILEQVMSDGVLSVAEVQAAIDAVPKQNTITFDIVTNGAPPNLDVSGSPAPVGTRRSSNGRASGGQVWAGNSYLVGEQGMEIFTPSQNGMITPNSRTMSLGGGQTDPRIITLLEQIANKQELTTDQLARTIRESTLQVIK